ncbi:proline dehydrogenase family protein [Paraburkholderia hospita]|uniref:proline dehydrogenase n=1 Tax=Paraburkholderia hospita TaxID=169430 RepID=A0AAN1MN88_9BURK|nr:proline dehydrogenase family protein [Paraburkholderia hospita]AUT73405.1 L-proline dehydrogenase [Paraburkholderia hospita]EIM98885.1 L-proline dehydrogenase [Paraburkholderia hospita]OUL71953.1 L-proline dehydrogenase [Paraburkholderia hospita]OUL76676.1 L-proline dehydrogenase [Paraburkholderia hospita]SEH77461.1 L-proline dehydrogenase [Paraburkholderia hospita]
MRILNTVAARAIPLVPRSLIREISRRYIAGATRSEALVRVRALDAAGYCTTIDVLGETASSPEEVQSMTGEYLALIDALHTESLRAELSIKPSALGLLFDVPACKQQVSRIVAAAESRGVSACIDMEDVSCTQKTLDLFAEIETRGTDVGVALQAYLRRTYDDIVPLAGRGSRLRICKGIYAEADLHLVDGASRDRAAINSHFTRHVCDALEAGSFVGIATHDETLIDALVAWIGRERIAPNRFEFQMLLGVCEPLRERLRAYGFQVRVYVPYGHDWYGYSTRRIKENPRIAGYILKSLFSMG